MLLNEQEIALWLHIADEPISFARAIESAVLEKLKAQEPVGVFADVNRLTPEAGTRWEHMVDEAYDGKEYIHLYRRPLPPADVVQKYDELLYAVQRKFPDETRHQTALRYIKTAEAPSYTNIAMKEMK